MAMDIVSECGDLKLPSKQRPASSSDLLLRGIVLAVSADTVEASLDPLGGDGVHKTVKFGTGRRQAHTTPFAPLGNAVAPSFEQSPRSVQRWLWGFAIAVPCLGP